MSGAPNLQPGRVTTSPTTQPRGIIPPHLVIPNFLAVALVPELVDLVVAQHAAFGHSSVYDGRIDPSVRKCVSTTDIAEFGPMLRGKLREMLPELMRRLGMPPAVAPMFEFEITAFGDGDFFARHIDVVADDIRAPRDPHRIRVVNAVYYFYALPKSFDGGALRLYAIADPTRAQFVDVEPTYNALLLFPSWAPHEVLPVSCPSRRFIDSRFTANLIVTQQRTPKPSAMDKSSTS